MSGLSLARPDITLRIDASGVIREASLSESIGEGFQAWVGRPWLETVGSGGESVTRMLEDAAHRDVSAFLPLVQRFPSGRELTIEYTTVRDPDDRAGLLALGKNLHVMAELQSRLVVAQQVAEREHWKLRDIETRYRLLFDASNEAVLMIGGGDLRVVEANPAAERTLGLAPGWDFGGNLAPKEREAFIAMLHRVREQGRAPGIVVHMGPSMTPWALRASVTTAEPGLCYLLHVSAVGAAEAPAMVNTMLERLPDGFVVVDAEGAIMRANRAFLDMAQVGALGAVRGEWLGRWLSKPGADAAVLLASAKRYATVKLFQSTLSGELGSEIPVEISAAMSGEASGPFCGVLLRDVSRRERGDGELQSTVEHLAGQLGQAPLLDMVKVATEAVERRLIKEALDRAGGNRTAAAELLGLSRQSLHTKLNRYAAVDEPFATTE